tara:strand:- start:134 stop:835 length:702 start_codon:yes stop_codon:yes gene_type:complete
MMILIFIFAALSFMLSASAGLGGSLILVPSIAMVFGTKQGIALASLLLACNNIFKVIAYHRTIPVKAAAGVVLLTILGAGLGAKLLVDAPEQWVHLVVIAIFIFTFFVEFKEWNTVKRGLSLLFAFFAGATSGFSGTSGPLKGVSLRNLNLDRFYFVGAASVVSLAGDTTKAAVFINGSFFKDIPWSILIGTFLIMPFAVFAGRFVNKKIGAQAYNILFWLVMTGYTIRLLVI